jgi:hypothetical protein
MEEPWYKLTLHLFIKWNFYSKNYLTKIKTVLVEHTYIFVSQLKTKKNTNMELSPPIISLLLHFLVLVSFVCPISSSEISNHQLVNQTFGLEDKFHKLKKTITTYLQEINKPAVKTIQVYAKINFRVSKQLFHLNL